MTQPQAIIGEGIISNNHDEQIIGEGLASANTYCDDLTRADFIGTVKAIQFREDGNLAPMSNSMPIPDTSATDRASEFLYEDIQGTDGSMN